MILDEFIPIGETDPNVLWDAATYKHHSERLKSRSRPVYLRLTESQYALLSKLLDNPNLNFYGDMEAMTREALIMLLRYYEDFLDHDGKTVLHRIRELQMRLSNERYAMLFQNQVDEQVTNLRSWTMVKEWDAVIESLEYWDGQMAAMSQKAWAARIAHIWLSHEGLGGMQKLWVDEMEPGTWQRVEMIIRKWERMARL